ncbi:MAG: replicative DNA helicase [Chloroflexi bacterium]|nr:replicative DNA helicase [Chloroflexota bacterium]
MYAERLLPHDLDAEESVIGSLLIDGDSILRVGHLVKPEDFYREKNQICFAACVALFQRNEAIDQVTLARELGRNNQLETVGGMAYLSHLVSITPTSANSEFYAQAVVRTSSMRRLIDAATKISAIGYEDTEDVENTLRQAEDVLFQVRSGQSDRGFIGLRQIFDQYLEDRAALAEPMSQAGAPVMTGYNNLDLLLGGLQRSDMIILGARPALGKSALAVNICINAAQSGAVTGIFSLEMSREQLALRILSSDAGIDAHRLRLNLINDAEEQRIIDSIGRLSELAVYVDDTPFQGMVEMRSKARRLSLEHGLDLLVLDYLQLVQGRGRGDNRVQEMSEISRSVKGMARELSVPVLACSQLSRAVEGRSDHRPMLSDLRDSGSIEQDADIVMFIHREDLYYTEETWEQQFPNREYPKNLAEIIVAKHRHGPTGSVKMRFRDNLVRFDALEVEDY